MPGCCVGNDLVCSGLSFQQERVSLAGESWNEQPKQWRERALSETTLQVLAPVIGIHSPT
jgi:hypothetical protein